MPINDVAKLPLLKSANILNQNKILKIADKYYKFDVNAWTEEGVSDDDMIRAQETNDYKIRRRWYFNIDQLLVLCFPSCS